jgi:MoxR-like ATPase
LIREVEDSGAEPNHKVRAIGEIGQNQNLTLGMLKDLIRSVQDSGADKISKAIALGSIGQNPNLNLELLKEVIQKVKEVAAESSHVETEVFGEIGQNPRLTLEFMKDLIREVEDSGAEPNHIVGAFGQISQNQNLTLRGAERFDWLVQDSGADKNSKAIALGSIGQNPNLNLELLKDLIQAVGDSGAEPNDKVRAFGEIGQNPNLTVEVLKSLIQAVKDSGVESFFQAKAFGEIGKNPNLTVEMLKDLIQAVHDHGTFPGTQSEAFGEIVQNPNLPLKLYQKLMEKILTLSPDYFLYILGKGSEIGKSYQDDLFARFQEIQERMEELKRGSVDFTVRILKGDETDLPRNLNILRKMLGQEREVVPSLNDLSSFSVDSHFDASLVTAHQLLNQVVQALAINRFALLSGPPASGKSEVGRYLGKILNWETVLFNCHRQTSQEEMMQKIGVAANGKTSFVITDGPLADALIHGKLFILNEINLAKPGSLAFLFSILADVNREFDYYNPKTGTVERRKIDEKFRMIATQTRRDLGRKELNAALKNRAVEIYAPAYSDLELIALIRGKFPTMGDYAPSLVRFYHDISYKMAASAVGEHAEGYVWNFRNLMRMAEGLAERKAPMDAHEILKALYDRVGISFTPKDREVFFDAVRNYEYKGTKIKPLDVEILGPPRKSLIAKVMRNSGSPQPRGPSRR